MSKTLLIKNGIVVPMIDPTIFDPGYVLVQGQRIASLGLMSELDPSIRADSTIDAKGKVVMPGLIDGHNHSMQQFERFALGVVPIRKKAGWWYLFTFESRLSEEDSHLSALASFACRVKKGITFVSEHGARNLDAVAEAMTKIGIRGHIAHSTMDWEEELTEIPSNMLFGTDAAIKLNEEIVKKWAGGGLVNGALSFRQIIVCTPELIKALGELAQEYSVPIQAHLCEGTYEIYFTNERWGLRPTEYLESLGVLPHLICAHSVLMSDNEVELLSKSGAGIVHCPPGNFSLLGMPKLKLMHELGVPISVGTDGPHSGREDLFVLLHMSQVVQQMIYGSPYDDRKAALSDFDLLKWATIEGAKVQRFSDQIGTLTPGKFADIIVVDISGLDCQPSFSPFPALVKSCTGQKVADVIINGKEVVRNGKLLTIDEERLTFEATKRAREIQQRFIDEMK